MAEGWRDSPAARAVLEAANDALRLNLGQLMAPDADPATLTQTLNAQPCLLVVGLMAAAALQEALGKPIKDFASFVAGHSLGEYTAVAAAGGFGAENLGVAAAVQLVRLRGEAMMQAEAGGMTAVLGLEAAQIQEILQGHAGVWLANDNCPGQVVISGTLEALESAENNLKAAGAKRVLRLPVGGAFHTPLQAAAATRVAQWLVAHAVAPLQLPCLMNLTAQPHTGATEVVANLIGQITQPVRWREGLQLAAHQGVTQALELGCGKVLTGLAPRCDARLQAHSLTNHEDLLRYLAATA